MPDNDPVDLVGLLWTKVIDLNFKPPVTAIVFADLIQTGDGPGLAFGGAAFLRANDFSASLAYRQELELRGGDIDAFPNDTEAAGEEGANRSDGKMGLQEWLVAGSVGYTIRPLRVDVYSHLTWNLLLGELDQTRLGASYNPKYGLHFHGEYVRFLPRFPGDSIFNYFNRFPYDRGRVGATLEFLQGLRVELGYFGQVLNGGPKGPKTAADPGGEGEEFKGSSVTHGPSAGIRFRQSRWSVAVSGEAASNFGGEYAFGGNYRLFQLFGDVSFLDGRVTVDGLVGLTTFQNDWFDDVDSGAVDAATTSWLATLGGRAEITDFVSTRLSFTKNFNSTLEGSYRVYTELALRY